MHKMSFLPSIYLLERKINPNSFLSSLSSYSINQQVILIQIESTSGNEIRPHFKAVFKHNQDK